MSLLSHVREHATAATWAALADNPRLEAELARFVSEGQAAWPDIQLNAEVFVGFLARHLTPEGAAPHELSALRAPELYLVCAYGQGDRAAHEHLEAQYMPRVQKALARLSTPPQSMRDIEQELRGRLIEMHAPEVERRGYSGRSDLAGWLCLSAIRMAGRRHSSGQRERPLAQAAMELLPATARDAETDLLAQRYKAQLQAALEAAIASLTARERNLLRYHFLLDLSIDQIAVIYRIHRATAARWVTRTRERLVGEARKAFLERVPTSPESLPEVVALLQSRLTLSLRILLSASQEEEGDADG